MDVLQTACYKTADVTLYNCIACIALYFVMSQ